MPSKSGPATVDASILRRDPARTPADGPETSAAPRSEPNSGRFGRVFPAPRIRNPASTGREQDQGTVCQFPRPENGVAQHNHGRPRRNLMSTQALNSTAVHNGMTDILLNHAGLNETLRDTPAR